MYHTLPPELIREVFKAASSDRATIAKLCLVCYTAYDWLIPALYNKITLSDPFQVFTFVKSLDAWESKPEREVFISKHIHGLWIGQTEVNELYYRDGGRLQLGHNIPRILGLCQHLRTLVLLDHSSSISVDVLPKSVEDLTVGPYSVHPLPVSALTHIKKLTSVGTFISEDEAERIILSPNIRHFRRIFPVIELDGAWHVSPFAQLDLVPKSTTLQKMEMMVYGGPRFLIDASRLRCASLLEDDRITISTYNHGDSVDMLYNEFISM